MIGVADYGAGNLASVRNAFGRLGREAVVFDRPDEIERFERVVLPGVGSFRVAMEILDSRGWPQALRQHAAAGRPLLGICLGMQLLFDRGEEDGGSSGIGLIPGDVVVLGSRPPNKVPHVGWNTLLHVREHPLFEGVRKHVDFYFVHSYHCRPAHAEDVVAHCDYGGEFVSSVARGNVVGMQFHPEKSQPVGLRILENFAQWDGTC